MTANPGATRGGVPASDSDGPTLGERLDMLRPTQISIPTLVRAEDGAPDRLGPYLGCPCGGN